MIRLATCLLALSLAVSCKEPANTSSSKPQRYRVEVVNTFPHDTGAYTQGLIFHDGMLYEGTGKKGGSHLVKRTLESTDALQSHALEARHFGEGITVFQDRIYQLTWKTGDCFVYALDDFTLLRQHRYSGQGWGLTHDGTHLIMSDGTARLTFRDPENFKPIRSLMVRDRGTEVRALNELEYIDGEIWANLYDREVIARIDPESGRVTGWVNARGLMPKNPGAEVMNGIAWDAETQRLFVTGKRWDALYEIKVIGE